MAKKLKAGVIGLGMGGGHLAGYLTHPDVEVVAIADRREDRALLMKMVADLKAAGFSIIWIEHVIETMVNSTDHLMCMSDGTQLLIGDPLEVMNSKLVEEVYLGVEEDE